MKENTRLVLTCAHFFREADNNRPYIVRGRGFSRRVVAVRVIKGTDIAVALLKIAAPKRAMVPLGTRPLLPQQSTMTVGFGGDKATPHFKYGSVLVRLPISFSRRLTTRVRPAALIRNDTHAIKGDSGGPIVVHEQRGGGSAPAIGGVQALILNPAGKNLGIATAAVVSPHLRAIREAARLLLDSAERYS